MFALSALQRWWHARRPPLEITVPYEVVCSCGRPLRGQRQRSSQLIVCPGCGRKRFILPSSSWSRRGVSGLSSFAAAPVQASGVNPRRLVLVVVLGGAAAMGLIFLAIKLYLRRPADTTSEIRSATDARSLMEAARRELREGNVRLALKELNAALEEHGRDPHSLNREEFHRLHQLRQQSDLLAHLLDNSLEEILQQALQVRNEEEWRAKFEDYRGRGVIFEDVLRRDTSGRPVLGVYALRAGDVEARVALEDLSLLRPLPLDPPRRWLFGARLSACRREEGGVWTIHFEPESAVLFTDEDAAAACWPGLVDDELRAVLRRQDEWLRR